MQEYEQIVARGKEGQGKSEIGEIMKHKIPVKTKSHRNEIYSMENTVNNNIISLYGDMVNRHITIIILYY